MSCLTEHVSFHDIPQLSHLPAKKCLKDQKILIEFSNVYGQSISQKSGRYETTMAKAVTIRFFCYDNDAQVSLTQIMNESGQDDSEEEGVSNENGENAEAEDEVTYHLKNII